MIKLFNVLNITWTGHFSNSAGSSVTSRRISPARSRRINHPELLNCVGKINFVSRLVSGDFLGRIGWDPIVSNLVQLISFGFSLWILVIYVIDSSKKIENLLEVLNHVHRLLIQIHPAHMYLPDRSPLACLMSTILPNF